MGYTYGLIQCPELRFDFEDLGQGGIRPLSMPWCVGLISVETIYYSRSWCNSLLFRLRFEHLLPDETF